MNLFYETGSFWTKRGSQHGRDGYAMGIGVTKLGEQQASGSIGGGMTEVPNKFLGKFVEIYRCQIFKSKFECFL